MIHLSASGGWIFFAIPLLGPREIGPIRMRQTGAEGEICRHFSDSVNFPIFNPARSVLNPATS